MRRIALVDNGCMQTLMCKICCKAWKRKEVLTVGGSRFKCCGVGVTRLCVSNRPWIDVVLVINKELLEFDLLLELDANKQLNEKSMTSSGKVKFSQRDKPICAAITISELDFRAEFDANRRIWIASWKWSGDQPPDTLKNGLSEYPTPEQLREEYNLNTKRLALPIPRKRSRTPKGSDSPNVRPTGKQTKGLARHGLPRTQRERRRIYGQRKRLCTQVKNVFARVAQKDPEHVVTGALMDGTSLYGWTRAR